jgi:crossover junction endodeoxyribonuclease RusA
MKTAEFFLDWPVKTLSPNARQHWSRVASAKKAAKRNAYYSVLQAGIGKIDADTITVKLSFFPPDARHRDTDNILSSCKAALDGVSEAIGIDDRKWNLVLEPRGPIEKNGMVKVKLEWKE